MYKLEVLFSLDLFYVVSGHSFIYILLNCILLRSEVWDLGGLVQLEHWEVPLLHIWSLLLIKLALINGLLQELLDYLDLGASFVYLKHLVSLCMMTLSKLDLWVNGNYQIMTTKKTKATILKIINQALQLWHTLELYWNDIHYLIFNLLYKIDNDHFGMSVAAWNISNKL